MCSDAGCRVDDLAREDGGGVAASSGRDWLLGGGRRVRAASWPLPSKWHLVVVVFAVVGGWW